MITQSEPKELLHYDPEIGIFTRLIRTTNRIKIGDIAGTDHNAGYIAITVKGKLYLAHRLAWLYMTGEWPKEIDHINHVRNDNRWVNLQDGTRSDNQRNQSLHNKNTSGITGVHWCKRDRRWVAQIRNIRERIRLGSFTDKFEAICARKSADNKYGYHANHGAAK